MYILGSHVHMRLSLHQHEVFFPRNLSLRCIKLWHLSFSVNADTLGFLARIGFFFFWSHYLRELCHTHTHILTAIGGQTSSRIPVWDPTGTLLLVCPPGNFFLGPYYLSVRQVVGSQRLGPVPPLSYT